MAESSTIGLAAFGKAGDFSVEVDSSDDGKYLITIDSKIWCIRCILISEYSLDEVVNFLHAFEGRSTFAELVIGSFGDGTVRIIKDNEFTDRFFLRVSQDRSLVDFVLINDAAKELSAAISDALEEFNR